MLVKYKHLITLITFAVLIWITAAFKKLVHQANSDLYFEISYTIFLLTGLLFLIKIFTTKNKDSFLNKL